MNKRYDFEQLNIFKSIQSNDIKMQVKNIIAKAQPIIDSINGEYKEYTLHDMGHCYRVAYYMDKLALGISEELVEKRKSIFSDLEYALMIISAVLHDIGMYFTEDEAREIKSNKTLYLNKFTYRGILNVLKSHDENADEKLAIHEVIRRIHHTRVKDFLTNTDIGKLMILDDRLYYCDIVERICRAHGEDYINIKKLLKFNVCGNYKYDERFIAIILRIADFIDLDSQRTPHLWYGLNNPKGISDLEWRKHFIIQNNDKIVEDNGKLRLMFCGISKSPEIHRLYLKFIDDLRKELINAADLSENDQLNKYILSRNIENNVKTEGFDYLDLRLNLDYNSITGLLMGEHIYRNKKLGLREIIQNSIDACKLRREAENNSIIYSPNIILELSKEKNTVKLIDNGIGMDFNVLKNYFLNVGVSYYNSDEFLYKSFNYNPIGKFGIGFLACFLLSKKVIVRSKSYKSESIEIELESGSEYVVTRYSDKDTIGTEIVLSYNDFFSVFHSLDELKDFVGTYFFTDIPILIIDDDIVQDKIINYSKLCEYYKSLNLSGMIKPKFFENIVCDNYDNDLQGNIVAIFKNYKVNEKKYDDEYVYLYETGSCRFEQKSICEIKNGSYCVFTYPVVDAVLYNDINNNKQIRDSRSLLAYTNKMGLNKKFFIPSNIEYYLFDVLGEAEIDNLPLDDVLTKSGIQPIDLGWGFDFNPYNIYKYNDTGLVLNSYRFPSYNGDYDNIVTNADMKFRGGLYYRDVFIKNMTAAHMMLPFEITVLGWCINNKDINNCLMLNVSRQGFMEIDPYIAKIEYVLLKYFNDNIDNKSEVLECYLSQQIQRLKSFIIEPQ